MNSVAPFLLLICGHELADGVVERGLQVQVRRDRLEIRYQLGLSPATARSQLAQWGVDVAHQAPVFPAYREAALPRMARGLRVLIDGVPRPLRSVSAKEVRRHHARIECVYELPAPPWDGQLHQLEVRDDNFPGWPGGRQVAIKARDGLEVISEAPQVLGRDEVRPWAELTPVAREGTRRLQAWIGEPGDRRPAQLWPWLLGATALLGLLGAASRRGRPRPRDAASYQAAVSPTLADPPAEVPAHPASETKR